MQNYINAIKKYMETCNEVEASYIFGSTTKGNFGPESDIDIAVLLSNTVDPDQYLDLKTTFTANLSEKLDRDIDIVILNEAGPFLRFQIFSSYKPVLIKDRVSASMFIARSFVEYCDFLPVKHRIESAILGAAGIKPQYS